MEKHTTTRNFLQVAYDGPLPEKLIRRIAEFVLDTDGHLLYFISPSTLYNEMGSISDP